MPTSIKLYICEKYCVCASVSGLFCLQESGDRVGMLVPLSSGTIMDNNRVTAGFRGMENSLPFICLFIFSFFHKNTAVEQDKVDLKNFIRAVSKRVISLLIKNRAP